MDVRDHRQSEHRLERELRRSLGERAATAPMPPGVANIPASWVRAPGPNRVRAALKLAAVAAVGTAFALIAVQLYRNAPLDRPAGASKVTAEAAASLVGVPVNQVVETRDGAVALRLVDAGSRAQLFLVSVADAGMQRHLLSEATVPQGVLVRDSNLVWTERLSCAPERGLRQPNIFFGAAAPAEPMVVSVQSQSTREGRLFLVVLDGADLTGVEVDIGDPARFEHVHGVSFDNADPCTGEPPRSFLGVAPWDVPLPRLAECLRSKGIDAEMQPDGGLSYNYGTADGKPVFDAAKEECEREIGSAP